MGRNDGAQQGHGADCAPTLVAGATGGSAETLPGAPAPPLVADLRHKAGLPDARIHLDGASCQLGQMDTKHPKNRHFDLCEISSPFFKVVKYLPHFNLLRAVFFCGVLPVHTKPVVWSGSFFTLQCIHLFFDGPFVRHMCTCPLKFQKMSRTRYFWKFHPCQTHFWRYGCLVLDKLSNLHLCTGGLMGRTPLVSKPFFIPP